MDKITCCTLQTINTLILFSLLASAGALARDNTYDVTAYRTGSLRMPTEAALQVLSDNDCYKSDQNRPLTLRIADLASLWHYATRILLPVAGASVAPRHAMNARNTDKGLVWRVGNEKGAVVVSANVDW